MLTYIIIYFHKQVQKPNSTLYSFHYDPTCLPGSQACPQSSYWYKVVKSCSSSGVYGIGPMLYLLGPAGIWIWSRMNKFTLRKVTSLLCMASEETASGSSSTGMKTSSDIGERISSTGKEDSAELGDSRSLAVLISYISPSQFLGSSSFLIIALTLAKEIL